MELVNQIDETICFNEKNIRVIGSYNEPWFVAKDVCEILKLKDVSNALLNIPEKWKGTKVISTLGGNQDMRIINEAGLYKLIMRSNKPIAQKFQEVVCEEILPSLRKKGEYKIQSIIDKNKELEKEKLKIEEEKNKLEEEIQALTKKYVKPVRQVYEDQYIIYLMTTDEGEKVNEYAVGKTIDLKNRKEGYDSNKLHDFKVIYYKVCNGIKAMDILEAIVLIKLGKYRCKAGRDVFLLPKFEGISTFTNIFDECIKFFEDVEETHIVFPRRSKNTFITDEHKDEHKEEQKEKNKKYNEEHKEEQKEKKKIYQEENNEKIVEKGKNYYEKNKEEIKQKVKEYRERNKEKIFEKKKIYREEHKEEIKEKKKEYSKENKQKIVEKGKNYYKDNKEEILKKSLLYYNQNKEKLKQNSKEYHEKNRETLLNKKLCECGSEVSHVGISRHIKTIKHQTYITSKIFLPIN